MKELTIEQIIEGTKGRLVQGSKRDCVERICINSREAKAGDLFVAIIGDVHDAHKFIPQAYQQGCRSFLISDEDVKNGLRSEKNVNVVFVDDTTSALQALASFYLEILDIKKIAVTGSTGKTSTRDLTWYVCSQKYKCGKNEGNLNNLIGVPLTILSFDTDIQAAVIEMGMDRFGEIDKLAQIVKPDIGMITNIGLAHIEHLGSQEGIFKAKMELVNYFGPENTLIISEESPFLTKERTAGSYRLITSGTDRQNDYIISDIDDLGIEGIQFTLEYKGQMERIALAAPGRHNAFNAALAIAAGAELGISMKEAAAGLAEAKLIRAVFEERNGIGVINDTYNASPDSMKSSIDMLVHSKWRRKIAILGDMFELGALSEQQHRLVGAYAAEHGVDLVVAVGNDARFIKEGASGLAENKALYFETKEALKRELPNILQSGDLVLVKGSRGMKMEQIVEEVMNRE